MTHQELGIEVQGVANALALLECQEEGAEEALVKAMELLLKASGNVSGSSTA